VQHLLNLTARYRGGHVKILCTTSKARLGLAAHFRRIDVLDLRMTKSPPWTFGQVGRSQLEHKGVLKDIEAMSRDGLMGKSIRLCRDSVGYINLIVSRCIFCAT
jgi:hypothetical protein